MDLPPGAIEAYRTAVARRQRWILMATVGAEAAAFAATAWIVLNAPSTRLYWVLVFLGVAWPVGLVIYTLIVRRSLQQAGMFLTTLAPRLRNVGPPTAGGSLLLFDNDLTLRFMPGPSMFWLFYSPAGTVASPTPEEAAKWTSMVRFHRVDWVTTKRGNPALRTQLEEVANRLGSRSARVEVRETTRLKAARPEAPQRYAVALFFVLDLGKRGQQVLAELDRIRGILEEAVSLSRFALRQP